MKCPYCGYSSKVIDVACESDRVIRKRRCLNSACNSRFYTEETDISISQGKRLLNQIKKELYKNEKK